MRLTVIKQVGNNYKIVDESGHRADKAYIVEGAEKARDMVFKFCTNYEKFEDGLEVAQFAHKQRLSSEREEFLKSLN